MCGIFGYVGREKCAPILHEALKRLEYRGYDSAGVATISDGKIFVKKDAGKIDEIHLRLNLDDLPGSIGIGHTRWATHGFPSMENAHPHVDCRERIAVAHNGIIENFIELSEELKKRGHVFRSKTDTEIIPHLIEEFIEEGKTLSEAVRETVKRLKGSYAILVISTSEPDKIVGARKESPLIVGIGEGECYCASDVPAFLPLTNKAVFIEDGELVSVTSEGMQIFEIETGRPVSRKPSIVTWSYETAEKEGFPHFMLKEIRDQSRVLRDTLRAQEIFYDLTCSTLLSAERVFLVGCGTSYHACLAASYIMSKLARLNAQPVIASEFAENYGDVVGKGCAIIAVSQSGETADTLSAVRFAREKGADVVSIVNVLGSSLTRLSKVYISQQSGPEIGVAATKTFTAQLIVLTKLAIKLAEKKKAITPQEAERLNSKMKEIPDIIQKLLDTQEKKIEYLASKYCGKSSFCFLGRGVNVATAMEGRLKLLELAYIPSLSYPAAESKHGFIAVIEEGFPVIFVAPRDQLHSKIIGNVMEMKARGAEIIALIEEGDEEIKKLADECVELPKGIPEIFTPITYIIPLQLFAYHMSVKRGCDPDRPRHLAKSVTVP